MNKLYRFLSCAFALAAFGLVGCSSNAPAETTKAVAFNEAATPHYDVVKRDEKQLLMVHWTIKFGVQFQA